MLPMKVHCEEAEGFTTLGFHTGRFFDASVKILTHDVKFNRTHNGELQRKNGPVRFCRCVKLLTPCPFFGRETFWIVLQFSRNAAQTEG